MTTKAYLGQARFLDMRIKSKIQQIDSLRELGEKLSPPLSRSGVNHRLEKIQELASRKD